MKFWFPGGAQKEPVGGVDEEGHEDEALEGVQALHEAALDAQHEGLGRGPRLGARARHSRERGMCKRCSRPRLMFST
eukprot:3778683-Alexandrium_andersonii.AAC.1